MFVELFARSNFSFLRGASHPEQMIDRAKELGYPTLGLCDLDGLYGVGRAFQECQLIDYQFLVGAELALTDARTIGLLCMNKVGYNNLCRLITQGKRNAPKGQSFLNLDDLLPFSEGLIAMATPPFKETDLLLLKESFGDRLYLALHRHHDWLSEKNVIDGLNLSQKLNIEAFATNRASMHLPSQKKALDILHCIHKGITLQEAGRQLQANAESYLKSEKQMLALWKDYPELVHKTSEIAERCPFSLKELRYQYPREAVPVGENSKDFLEKLVWEGAVKRYLRDPLPDQVKTKIRHELDLILKLGFEDYFITIWDIVNFARSKNILCQGRGSAANSVVCYALEITSIDPVAHELLFERFISEERGDPPDIDVDFEHERREEVIQYIYQKYGHKYAGMVCVTVTFRSRMALRETAKVFGLPLATINRMIKWMGHDGFTRLTTPEGLSELQNWNLSVAQFKQLIECAMAIKGFPRHLGIHSGGFVLSQTPLFESVPVEKATMEGRWVVQWNKDDLEALGLMKIDVLALGMLTCLQKNFELLKKYRGISLTLATTPLEDKNVFEMVQRADTVGAFQIESRAQMSMLPRLKPKTFYDYVVQVAIVRPGPLQGGMVHPYLRRRQGLEKIEYAHPALIPILKKTMGVPIFQEQVMKMAVAIAGFTPGESDELRRVMSSTWRKGDRMEKLKTRLMRGMKDSGVSDDYCARVYKTIEGFGAYGFPESHAASFALLTAVSCYIKHYHPDIFACGLLNSQPMGFYSPHSLISDAKHHGVKVLNLDINKSEWDYTITKTSGELRMGFRALYGFPEKEFKKILVARNAQNPLRDLNNSSVQSDSLTLSNPNPFSSVADLVKRTSLRKEPLLKLAAGGAFECFGFTIREALWEVIKLPRHDHYHVSDFEIDISEASSSADSESVPSTKVPVPASSSFKPMHPWEQIRSDFETMGLSPVFHPLQALRPHLKKSLHNSKSLKALRNHSHVHVAGLISVRQRPPTANGTLFLTLEDEFGFMNAIVNKEVYEQYRLTILQESLIEVHGHLQTRDGVWQIQVRKITPLEIDWSPVTGSSNDRTAQQKYLHHSKDFS